MAPSRPLARLLPFWCTAQRRPSRRLPRITTSKSPSVHYFHSSGPPNQRASSSAPHGLGYLEWLALGLAVVSPLLYKMALDNPVQLDSLSLAERDTKTKSRQGVTEASPMRLRMEKFIKEQQTEIVAALAACDGGTFRRDEWTRDEGGGGITCVLQDGAVFEKAGVGVSVVYGTLPRAAIARMHANHKGIAASLEDLPEKLDFFAAGLSLVVHPRNPMAPTAHLNYRYFETARPEDASAAAWWFGGGSDLTPSYLFDEDAIEFHGALKRACDAHDRAYYPRFKRWCDEYFFNKHRGETRGVGGIFFDDLDGSAAEGGDEGGAGHDKESLFAFVQDCLRGFAPTYVAIVDRRKGMPFTPAEKEWQQLRRGKYVEFNLVHDRGTAFGLNTPGARVESILMSLPLTASWRYMHEVQPGSREARLVEVLKNPKDWV